MLIRRNMNEVEVEEENRGYPTVDSVVGVESRVISKGFPGQKYTNCMTIYKFGRFY